MVAWQCLMVFVVVKVGLAGGFGFGLAVFDGVCYGESGFGSGFLMVGVGLAVVADGSGCEVGFGFCSGFLMMGGGSSVFDGGGGGWRCLLR